MNTRGITATAATALIALALLSGCSKSPVEQVDETLDQTAQSFCDSFKAAGDNQDALNVVRKAYETFADPNSPVSVQLKNKMQERCPGYEKYLQI